MSGRDLSSEVLQKIKDVRQKPRWYFRLQNYLVWFFGFASLVIGSLSFAVILHMMITNDWDVYNEISGSLFKFIITTLPYLWLIFLALFVLVGYYNIKHTKKGYRFSVGQLVIYSVVASIFFGAIFHQIGIGQAIEDSLNRRVPFYQDVFNARKKIWAAPDKGFLAGIVLEVEEDKAIIRDIEGNIWYVSNISTSTPQEIDIMAGDMIRMLGQMVDSEHFEARQFLSMPGMRWMHELPPPPSGERKIRGMRIIR
ncbi:hypothetical protein KKH39_01915 [Patescibacteria group bacterium]|nr:hypothetical protein [Patescibacteria group bacterium]